MPTKKKSSGSRSYGGNDKRSRSASAEPESPLSGSAYWGNTERDLGVLADSQKSKLSPSRPILEKPRFNFGDTMDMNTILEDILRDSKLSDIEQQHFTSLILAIINNNKDEIKIYEKILKNKNIPKETRKIIHDAIRSLPKKPRKYGGVGTPDFDKLPQIAKLPSQGESELQELLQSKLPLPPGEKKYSPELLPLPPGEKKYSPETLKKNTEIRMKLGEIKKNMKKKKETLKKNF